MINPQNNQISIKYYDFNDAFELTKMKVEKSLTTAPHMVREYMIHLAKGQGKFIRARALLICALNENKEVHENAVSTAIAIELLHLATLVHDDIIDDSDTRRGSETLQKKYGKRKAVICGDYLLSIALQATTGIKEKEKYTEFFLPQFVSRVCLGELEQYSNNGNLKLSTLRYLKIIRGKTAALFEGAFLAGAIFSGEEKKYQSDYSRLGRYIGMIFQLTDDCIDFEASEKEAKKTVGRDYENGVVTLPLIHAIKGNEEFAQKLKNGFINTEEIIKQVVKLNGIVFTKGISSNYYSKSLKIISSLEINDEKKKRLTAILDKAYNGI